VTRNWVGLAVLMLPCMLVSLDAAVLNLALPSIEAALHPSGTQQLWIADSYTFFIAGSLIAMGVLGDRIGRRRLLFAGSAAFGAASVFAAFAPTAGALIAARILTGIAGAALAPSTLALVRTMFTDERERRVAIGIWTAGFALGGIAGPLAGGALVEHFWWGAVFLIAVPVVALVLLLGPRLLPEAADRGHRAFDLPGAVLSLAAILTFVYGLKRLAGSAPDARAVLALVLGAVLAVGFARRQRRHPMVDRALFRRLRFTAALGASTLVFFVLDNVELANAQYLQLVTGLAPLAAGLWSLPGVLAYLAAAALAPAMARLRPRGEVIGAGLFVVAAGFAVLAAVPGIAGVVTGSVVFSLGLGPVYTLATELIVESAPTATAGAAAAIGETGAELGGALGIAVLGSLGLAVSRSPGDSYADGFVAMTATSAVLIAVAAVIAAIALVRRKRRRFPSATTARRKADNQRTGTAHAGPSLAHQGEGATTR
jgi:DHA2 family multidrug resistance protein-like MFS transporter